MKRRKLVRVFALLISIVMLATGVITAQAATGFASKGSPSSGVNCTVTTYSTVAEIFPHYSTQALHTNGIETTITISKAIGKESTSSAKFSTTFGATYLGVSVEAGLEAGISESVIFTIESSVSYKIGANKSSGRYRIETVFPQDHAHFVVSTYSKEGTKVVLDKTISSVPRTNDAYYRIQRYADA